MRVGGGTGGWGFEVVHFLFGLYSFSSFGPVWVGLECWMGFFGGFRVGCGCCGVAVVFVRVGVKELEMWSWSDPAGYLLSICAYNFSSSIKTMEKTTGKYT